MKKILVTGSDSRFGIILKKIKSKYLFTFRNKKQLNILSANSIAKNINKYKPDYILHLAGLSRPMSIHEKDFFALRALDLMNGMPKTIGPNENIIIANEMMNKWKINSLVVLDDLGSVVGILQKYDLDKNTV